MAELAELGGRGRPRVGQWKVGTKPKNSKLWQTQPRPPCTLRFTAQHPPTCAAAVNCCSSSTGGTSSWGTRLLMATLLIR